jgi:hypothetical protein
MPKTMMRQKSPLAPQNVEQGYPALCRPDT